MIPWRSTSDSFIQVRPHYGEVPVAAPGQYIVGWEVRVWHTDPYLADACNVCRRPTGFRKMKSDTAERRPDYDALDHVEGCADLVWVPYAHECSIPVPWAANRRACEGWEQPHHHPAAEFVDKARYIKEHYDARATPVLYANAQLAYAAGLALLKFDEPARMHWDPAA